MILYKYFPDNLNSYKALSSRGLWCDYAKNMNDPFECLGLIDRDISIEEINKLKVKFKDSKNTSIQKILKNTDANIKKFLIQQRKEFIQKFAFCSLSFDYRNIQMWSHYASNHTGFVVGFEFDTQIIEKNFYKIEYVNEMPFLNYEIIFDVMENNFAEYQTLIKDISIKSKDWRKEKEIRVWRNKPGYFVYNKDNIKEIYFGINTDVYSMKLVLELIENIGKNVKIKKLKFNEKTLKLNINHDTKSYVLKNQI